MQQKNEIKLPHNFTRPHLKIIPKKIEFMILMFKFVLCLLFETTSVLLLLSPYPFSFRDLSIFQ
jgi:hypothetical protein